MSTRFILAFLLFVSPTFLAAQENAVLSVSGTGQVAVAPDMARISVGVEVEAKTAKQALALNSARMRDVFGTLAANNIAKRDIQTSQFSLSPQWSGRSSSSDNPPRITGYLVTNVVSVKIRDLANLGAALDALTKSGANRIHSVQFSIANPKPHLDKARQLAVAEAMRKADLYSAAAGLNVGAILSIAEGASAAPGGYAPQMRAMSDAVPIAQGELGLNATVTIRFALIKP